MDTIVWNLADQRVLFRDSEVINALSAFPMLSLNGDGSRVGIGLSAFDKSVQSISARSHSFRVLEVKGGREIFHMTSSGKLLFAAELSSDGRFVATSSLSVPDSNRTFDVSRLLIQEVETGRIRFDSGDQKSIRIGSVRFSPDGHRLAAIFFKPSSSNSFIIVDVDTGRKVATESLPESSTSPKLAFDPDGRSLVVASASGHFAQVRDAASGQLPSPSLGVGEVADVVIRRSDGRLLVNTDQDIREWDLPLANPISLDAGLVLKNVARVGVTADGNFVMSRDGRQLVVWRMPNDPSQFREIRCSRCVDRRGHPRISERRAQRGRKFEFACKCDEDELRRYSACGGD